MQRSWGRQKQNWKCSTNGYTKSIFSRQNFQSLPHSESYYSREDSKLNYFDDSSLTLHRLYNLFIDYYASVTGDTNTPIRESAYAKFSNHHINFSFSSPQKDVCDICYKYETLGKDKLISEKHKKSAEDYKRMKTKMANTKSVLHCEFIVSQNLPLPY